MLLEALTANKRAVVDMSPTSEFWYHPVGRQTGSGVSVDGNTAQKFSGYWAALRFISGISASLPIKTLEEVDADNRVVRKDLHIHRVVHDEPNPEMDSFVFWEMMLASREAWGNGFAEKEFNRPGDPNSGVRHLWPIHRSRVLPYSRNEQGEIVWPVRNNDGTTTELESWEMFNLVGPLSDDGIIGKGVAVMAAESIGVGVAAERHGGNFLGNAAMPSGVLQHPKKLDAPSRQNMRREWHEAYAGPQNAGKVAILWEGVTWQAMGIDPEKAQLLQTREFQVTEMARWFLLPPHVLADLTRATFSNIESQQIALVVYSLRERLARTEKACKRQLLTEREKTSLAFKYVIEELLRGDIKSRYEAYSRGFDRGWFTVNDILRKEDMNAIGDEGDKRFINSTLVPIEQAGQNASSQQASDGDNEQRAGREMAQEFLAYALGRMFRKEANAATRAADKSAEFLDWMESFYGKHEVAMIDALRPVAFALGRVGVDRSIADIASDCVSESKAMLTDIYDTVSPGDFVKSVSACVSGWESERSQKVATQVCEGE